MSVPSTYEPLIYTGTGSTDTFIFRFRIYDDTDILVTELDTATEVETVLALTTDYTITGRSTVAWVTSTAYVVDDYVTNGGVTYRCVIAHTSGTFATDLAAGKWIVNSGVLNGGNVVLTAGNLAVGKKLRLELNLPFERETDFNRYNALPTETLNNDLDKSVLREQMMLEQLSRSFKASGFSGTNLQLPAPSAGKCLVWNVGEDGFVNSEINPIDLGAVLATQAEAEGGAENLHYMSALRTKQAIDANVPATYDGSKFDNLADIPAGAGVIPSANIPTVVTFTTGMILMWSGTVATIPSGWYLCDGNNGTPDLRDRFIVGAKQDDAGVAKTNITGSLTQSGDGTIPSHSHDGGTFAAASDGAHTHTLSYKSGTDGTGSDSRTSDPFAPNESTTVTTRTTCGSDAIADSAGSHTHSISGSSATSGTGTVVIAKYYALCFIMKG